jgi:hypothetical protein
MKISAINFPSNYDLGNNSLEYRDIKEMSQGGPEIGKLFINGKPVSANEYFSGPLVFQENLNKVIVPILHRGFFNTKFKIAVIDLKTGGHSVIDKKENLILLKSVSEEKIISYYNDIDNNNLKTIKF